MDYQETATLQGEYQVLANPDQRQVIKRRAVDLLEAARGKKMLIFLDKTARPLSQFVLDLWGKFYPDQDRPKIVFVNLGSEKGQVLSEHNKNIWGSWDLIQNLIPKLSSEERLEEVYGKGNVENLKKLLWKGEGESRLIIDESYDRGNTKMLAEQIFNVLDGNRNRYSFFVFLDTYFDKAPFKRPGRPALVPWHTKLTLVHDKDKHSFFSSLQEDHNLAKKGRQVRREIKMLAQEILESRGALE